MKKIITLFLVIVLGITVNSVSAQSKAITQFEEQVDGYNLYLYQSLIRVLNKDKNEDFNLLIKDLDHLKFLMTDSIGDQSIMLYKNLMEGLGDEGYEELMNFDNIDYKATVLSLESGRSGTSWVVVFNMGEMSGLFEMMGSVDTKYLNALSSLNMEKLKKMMPMMEDFEESFPEGEYEEIEEDE
ncbi:MAG: hypothetical protein ACI8XB_001144 [Patiriisocius sp.]|jgi:hypothetical protein